MDLFWVASEHDGCVVHLQIRRAKATLPAALGVMERTRCNGIKPAGQQARDQGTKLGDADVELLDAEL